LGRPRTSQRNTKKTKRSTVRPHLLTIGNPDPDRSYRWVSRGLLTRYHGIDPRGWEPLTDQNSKGETLGCAWAKHGAGTGIEIGDLVLCSMPKERHDEMVEDKMARIPQLRSVAKNYMRDAKALGMEPTLECEEQMHGMTENN